MQEAEEAWKEEEIRLMKEKLQVDEAQDAVNLEVQRQLRNEEAKKILEMRKSPKLTGRIAEPMMKNLDIIQSPLVTEVDSPKVVPLEGTIKYTQFGTDYEWKVPLNDDLSI